MGEPMIVAVDGPAASGKGTIARALALHYGLPHLDTGLLYRAVAFTVSERGLDPGREADAIGACDFADATLTDPALRSAGIGQSASIVSAHPGVRAMLVDRQRRFAHQSGGAVLDGRDIGTVIAPDADAKLYVGATGDVRARRRHEELAARGLIITPEAVLGDIEARDRRDSERAIAPLQRAPDAMLLDTSVLSIEAAVAAAIALVDGRLAARLPKPGKSVR